ncbi:hypothetical protein COU77_01580 [Candidatus Peregrinibacteria bacterium CG10_big_fil_rev_8_21_14_0_10_49_16]|nr:MAG: hypothetical protein COU77_01580 [Candidatus Peregrinibacteria bacterium CG10_big_fil_rev_8_21_14_0_10_49_16]
MHRLFATIATLIVAIAIVGGFVLAGSPQSERIRRIDERRIEDLRMINNEILTILFEGRPFEPRIISPETGKEMLPEMKRPLPTSLQEVQEQALYQRVNILDPVSGEEYEYQVLDETNYELCALFDMERVGDFDIFWDHPAGRHCFAFNAQKPQYR